MIQADGAETMELLSTDQYDPGRDPENGNSVFQTWKISFDQIRKTKPRAADILSLISVLDRQGISDDLLKEEIEGNLHHVRAIGTLKAFSLISEQKRKAVVYGLRRTVQLATRNWLEIQGELSRWQQIAMQVVANHSPHSSTLKYWPAWEAITPHVQAVLSYDTRSVPSLLCRAKILREAGSYDLVRERHGAIYERVTEALAIYETCSDTDNPDRLLAMARRGRIFLEDGSYNEAESLLEEVYQSQRMILGDLNPATLTTLGNYGVALAYQNKPETEAIYRRCIEGREVLGREHSGTLAAVKTLVTALYNDGDYKESEKLHHRVLDIHRKSHDDLAVLSAEIGLAQVDLPLSIQTQQSLQLQCLIDQGEHDKAKGLLDKVLTKSKRNLGLEHPKTLVAMYWLAIVLRWQRQYEDAEGLMEEVVERAKVVLVESHPRTLEYMYYHARTLYLLGRPDEEMERHVILGRERVLGPQNPEVFTSKWGLSQTLRYQQRFEEVIDFLRQALEGKKSILGEENPKTQMSFRDYFSLLVEMQGLGLDSWEHHNILRLRDSGFYQQQLVATEAKPEAGDERAASEEEEMVVDPAGRRHSL